MLFLIKVVKFRGLRGGLASCLREVVSLGNQITSRYGEIRWCGGFFDHFSPFRVILKSGKIARIGERC